MKRRAGAVVGLALLGALALLALWRWGASRGGAEDTASRTGSAGSADRAGAATARARIDPRTVARGSIAGAIIDERKAPVPRARVCAEGSSRELAGDLLREPGCTTTDEQGRYRIAGLLPASYSVSAAARPYQPGRHRPAGDYRESDFALAAGEHRTGVDIELRAGGVELTGTVSDLTGGPIAGARVRAHAGWRRGTAFAEADEQGRFSLWVSPGQLSVTGAADGYADVTEWIHAPGKIDLLLAPEASLAGVVVDAATGRPVEDALVRLSQSHFTWADDPAAIRTDAQGQFRFHRLTPGRHVAEARAERGYGRAEGSTLVGLGQHVDGVTIRLFPAVRVEGTVIAAATKEACKSAYVTLRDPAQSGRAATLDPRGGAALVAEGVLPGRYEVTVGCTGAVARERYEPLTISDRDVTGLVWEVDAGAAIRGRVLAASGAPIEGATVTATRAGGPARAKDSRDMDLSGPDGAYQLTGLSPGAHQLDATTERGVAPEDGYRVEVAAGQTATKDLVVEGGGTLRGTVVDAAGRPVPGVLIQVSPLAGFLSWSPSGEPRTDEVGAFVIEGVRPGEYRVTAQRSWFAPLRKPGTTDDAQQGERATVRAGQTATVKLVVEAQTGAIRGSVADAAGRPITDAYVSATRESDAAGAETSGGARGWFGDLERPALTGVDGAFTIGKLSPGTYTLRAYRKGGGEAVAEHVPVGGTARLQIKPTGSIEGTVRWASAATSTAIDSLAITASEPRTSVHREEQFFRTGGRFALRDLPRGRYRISAEAAGGQQQTEVELAEGEARTGVALELVALVDITGRVVERGTRAPIPGVHMLASPAKGAWRFIAPGEDREYITDETGRFTIRRAPAGEVALRGFPGDFRTADHAGLYAVRTVTAARSDVGDLIVVKNRIKPDQAAGEHGIRFAEPPADAAPDQRELKVSFLDPAGPAARTELRVGDVIVSIDGVDVTGEGSVHAWTLLRAPPGTRITLGTKRGPQVAVVLAAP